MRIKVIALFSVVLIGGLVFWVGKTEKNPAVERSPIPENASSVPVDDIIINDAVVDVVPTPWPEPERAQLKTVDENIIKDGESKLSVLVNEYNQNLDNPDRRQELEKKLLLTSKSYKQEVLAKIKKANSEIPSNLD